MKLLNKSRQAADQRLKLIRKKKMHGKGNLNKKDKYLEKAYKKIQTDISFEQYKDIYQKASDYEENPLIITKRVIRKLEMFKTDEFNIDEMIKLENELLKYSKLKRK